MPSKPHPAQASLPLAPQPPCEAQIQAKVAQIWRDQPHLHRTWPRLVDLLQDPERAKRLRLCARQALLARQRTIRT